ncbi:hypothetical protein ACKY3M_004631, partial [Shigella sonnei]|uniref:hypothetical protein n=3 Tax=Shigella sonnei TaxID=624 RepID=UPI001C0A684F
MQFDVQKNPSLDYYHEIQLIIFSLYISQCILLKGSVPFQTLQQGKITKARSPQGLTPDSFCPWLL